VCVQHLTIAASNNRLLEKMSPSLQGEVLWKANHVRRHAPTTHRPRRPRTRLVAHQHALWPLLAPGTSARVVAQCCGRCDTSRVTTRYGPSLGADEPSCGAVCGAQLWLERIRFMRGCQPEFIAKVLLSLRALVFAPGDVAFGNSLYVLHHGVAICTSHHAHTRLDSTRLDSDGLDLT
jgi:hypothetical protein